ncbi:SDR family NAD(P)-dependent oxidoreductase [Mucilaginibacter lutimaris]|uniref:SDR family NAD(P)-dependent oxidoreductase n=1 Tax=Mucilaginibacter lutimaris TaxID=931629 RepID=A0ABW2ZE03_9SPHI
MSNQKVWFVTGASKGLGLSLVKQLLTKGYNVAATSRNIADLENAVGKSESFLPLAVNLTDEKSVNDAISQAISLFGKIDVVVNNAGYGIVGALEELSDAETRANFDINVFGSLNVIRAVMPHLREQQSGHIFNISSIGGFSGNYPGFGIYCATKFAVQGFTESLSAEARSLGIKATIVSPGYFRTNFLAPDALITPKNEIEAYKTVREVQDTHLNQIGGNQPGDPEKGVAAIITVAEANEAPLHLFLGQDAYDVAYQKMSDVKNDLETWKEVTVNTGY